MQAFNDGPRAGHSSDDRLLRGEYKVEVSGFIGQAWELFKQEPGKYIGFSFVLFVVYLIEQVFGKLLDSGKFGGGYQDYSSGIFWGQLLILLVISISISLLTIPLYAGANVVAFKQMSGQKAEFSNFFHGYRYMASLIASSLAQGFIMFVAIFVIALVSGGLVFGLGSAGHLSPSSDHPALYILLIIPIFVVTIYIGVLYVFSQSLIIDRRLGFWQAMEMSRKVVQKQWFSVFGLVIVIGLLNVLGALALIVGLLVTLPVSYLTLAVAYREIFGLQSSDW